MLIVAESSYGTLAALFWWRTSNPVKQRLPAERFASAIQTGIRYAYNNALLRATLLRTVGFFLFASAYWALLPLIAHDRISGGSQLYGVLLGSIGAGALGGALGLEWLRSKLGPDRLVALGELGAALALVLFGAAREPITAIAASLIAGACWIVVLSSLNVSAQFSLPEWVRGRGLAVYVTVFFGAMTLGSACWGEIARVGGLAFAHFLAAGGALLAIPLTWRCKPQSGAAIDLAPSMHWPAPIVSAAVDADAAPVLVTIEYHVSHGKREMFLMAVDKLARERRRDGAYAWGIFEDVAQSGRFIETFTVESWLEHLRQHERVTNADRVIEEHVHRLLQTSPKITHLVAPRRSADV